MERNILLLRHCQLCDDSLVLSIENLDNLLEHLHPARYWLLGVLKGKLGNQTSCQLALILKRISIKLLFFRFIFCDRCRPDGQSSAHEIFAALLQFCKRPLILLSDPSIHADTAIIEAVLHGFLFSERAIAVLRVIGSQRKVCHAMKPQLMYLLIIIAQFLLPYRRQVLWHDMLNRISAIIAVTIYILILRSTKILEALKNINLVLAVHKINRPLCKSRFEFLIIREASTFLLR